MSSLLRRLCRRPLARGHDAGMTLVELLVVSVISMILLGAVGMMFTGSLQASRKATANVSATADARLAMDVVERRLRVAVRPTTGATMFTEATATSMTFFASLSTPGSTADPAPSQVRYVVDTTRKCLLETVTPAAPAVPRTSCLAFGEVTPVFSYYQVAKRPTASRPSPSPVPSTPMPLGVTGLSSTDAMNVGAVELQLSLRNALASATSNPVLLRSRVLLVNNLNEESA